MSDSLTVSHLRLTLRDRRQQPRAEHLIADALATASLPGIPAGAMIALRRLDLGRLSLREPAQAIALRIERLFAALPHRVVHVSRPQAELADVVWAGDAIEALVALAEALVLRTGEAAWFWPHLVMGWHGGVEREAGLTNIWHHALKMMPDPWLGPRRLLLAAAPPVRTRLIAAIETGLARRLAPVAGSAVRRAPPRLVAAAPAECIMAVRAWGAADLRSFALAAIWLAEPGPRQGVDAEGPTVTDVEALISQWRGAEGDVSANRPSLRLATEERGPVPAASSPQPAERSDEIPGALTPESLAHYSRVPAAAEPEVAPAPARLEADEEALITAPMSWDGQPSATAGAILLIALVQRALPAADLDAGALRGVVARLARQGDRIPLAWLDRARAGDADLARAARRWLRRADRQWRSPGEPRLTVRRLIRRFGQIRISATHLDVTFALAVSDIRVRRLGLDLDPGWVPWLGRVVRIHYHQLLSPEGAS